MWKWIKEKIAGLKRQRRLNKMADLVGNDDPKYIAAVLDEVRLLTHKNVDAAFKAFVTPEILEMLAQAEDTKEVRTILRQLIKQLRTVIIVPLRGNIDNKNLPKHWR